MANCYKCDTLLTEANRSEEHIILNACGGRLKSKNLLCKGCNSEFGETFDAKLANATNDLANLLLIKRHRGEPRPIKGKVESSGEDYYIEFGGKPIMSKPIISEEVEGEKIELSITARNEKEFRQILTGLKKKYPQLDIEKTVESATYKNEYLDEPIKFQSQIGGEDVFKSITKSAINYFILKDGENTYIKHLMSYLEGVDEADTVWMHYPEQPIYLPAEDEVSHIVKLVGNPEEKVLYTYIELFNVHNFIVKLSEEYEGQPLDETYVYDLIKMEEIQRVVPLNYSRGQLLDLFENKDAKPFSQVQKKFERTLTIAMKRQSSKHNQDLIVKAMNNSLGKHPEGTEITKEMINELTNELMKEITPMILHHFRKQNPPEE